MDLVDIDKVLDDFELNEDKSERKQSQICSKQIDKRNSLDTSITATTSRISHENVNQSKQEHNQHSNIIPAVYIAAPTVPPIKHFVNVSSVFSSLNDYVEAKVDTDIVLGKDVTKDFSKAENEIMVNGDQLEDNNAVVFDKPDCPVEVKSDSNSEVSVLTTGTVTSSTATTTSGEEPKSSKKLDDVEETMSFTSEEISSISVPNHIDDDGVDEVSNTNTAEYSLQSGNVALELSEDNAVSSIDPLLKETTNTSLASSSSYCYDNDISSSILLSKNFGNTQNLSSLSKLSDIDDNEETNNIENDSKIFEKNQKSDNGFRVQNNQQQVNHQQQQQLVNFEATMDDVSDTELESYLQELEIESLISSGRDILKEDIESIPIVVERKNDDRKDDIDKTVKVEVLDSKIDDAEAEQLTDEKDEKICDQHDSISQASTVELIDSKKRLQTDFEVDVIEEIRKDNPADDPVDDIECDNDDSSVKNDEEILKITVPAVDVSINESQQEQLGIEVAEMAAASMNIIEDSKFNSDEVAIVAEEKPIELIAEKVIKPLTRPDSLDLNIPPSRDTNQSAGQTPHQVVDISAQMSTSSSDDFTPMPQEQQQILASNSQQNLSLTNLHQLGKVPPYWVPDNVTDFCMQCNMKFSLIKRRHHCRACGQVLCSICCSLKSKLEYLGDQEARICVQCDVILNESGPTNAGRRPNPNNPMEYCSVLPPHQQVSQQLQSPMSVMVPPASVLKKEGAPKSGRKDKNVIFSDGIRPGSDLTELDSDLRSSSSSLNSNRRVQTPPGTSIVAEQKSFKTNTKLPITDKQTNSYIPSNDNLLPPVYTTTKTDYQFSDVNNDVNLMNRLKSETLKFAIQRNLFVFVKIIQLSCCINKTVINFTTQGMRYVGQDEIIILLEVDDSNILPKDVFLHLKDIYLEADKGQTITELGFSLAKTTNFLGSREHSGFLYIRPTFQCLQGVQLPEPTYLIGILIHKWEIPWAKVFPLRLMLRLGAYYRYYPSPHVSVRGRESVYTEIADTIINFLADFRTYSYTLATIRGMFIHMEDRSTNILIPKNRYDQIVKALNNSSDHILALSGNFSKKADGHLVCIQNIDSGSGELHAYSTQAINIQGHPRTVTGASFLVLNGALKSTSGLSGKCSIVEDGLMVQILPTKMTSIRDSLKNMKDVCIPCGPIDAEPSQQELVNILWTDNDTEFNIGVTSPIDDKQMDGIPSIRVHRGLDYSNANHFIRWTEVFIIRSDEETDHTPVNISKISEQIAQSASVALVSFLDLLAANGLIRIGLRVTLDQETVCYEAGSQKEKLAPLYMNALDNELIPTLHRQATGLPINTPIILELIFYILDK